jgi:hypothetical protein
MHLTYCNLALGGRNIGWVEKGGNICIMLPGAQKGWNSNGGCNRGNQWWCAIRGRPCQAYNQVSKVYPSAVFETWLPKFSECRFQIILLGKYNPSGRIDVSYQYGSKNSNLLQLQKKTSHDVNESNKMFDGQISI